MPHVVTKLVRLLTPRRRWTQFSLASLFLVVTTLCVALGVWSMRAERQRRAVAAIEALGGFVEYASDFGSDETEAFPEILLRRWLPRDYWDEVQEVALVYTDVADTGLTDLQGLTSMRYLDLKGTPVTDAGLVHLHDLTTLQVLCLSDTQITDSGLAHVQRLAALQDLDLYRTRVTDAGVAKLQKVLPNCWIVGP